MYDSCMKYQLSNIFLNMLIQEITRTLPDPLLGDHTQESGNKIRVWCSNTTMEPSTPTGLLQG